ncbi:glycosyltransferase family 2 protein [Candidatus Woesearchaeota archaeon]|nr:glycosyltransferase family 2 protein [Candidatus Woesearchaeota archaeon]
MNISVVIPAYNEENRIKKSIIKIIAYLENNFGKYEILVVDDGSTDSTHRTISELNNSNISILRNKKNKGKGHSIKKGVLSAEYELILVTDADLSTPIEELGKFIKYIKQGYDVVFGSRNLKGSKIKESQPFYRQLMGKTFPLLVNIITSLKFKDTQCGFKLFKNQAAKEIFNRQTIDGFAFDAEILFIANNLKYRIKEAPVVWSNSKESKVSPIKDSIKMFVDILKIRLNDLSGKYKIR